MGYVRNLPPGAAIGFPSDTFKTSNGQPHVRDLARVVKGATDGIDWGAFSGYLINESNMNEYYNNVLTKSGQTGLKQDLGKIRKGSAEDTLMDILGPLASGVSGASGMNNNLQTAIGTFLSGQVGEGPMAKFFAEQGNPPVFNQMMRWAAKAVQFGAPIDALKSRKAQIDEREMMQLDTPDKFDQAYAMLFEEDFNPTQASKDWNYSGIPGRNVDSPDDTTYGTMTRQEDIERARLQTLSGTPPWKRNFQWYLEYMHPDEEGEQGRRQRDHVMELAKDELLKAFNDKKQLSAEHNRNIENQRKILQQKADAFKKEPLKD